MKALNIFLIVFNFLMVVWAIVNIYREYSPVWVLELVISAIFSVFWIVVYRQDDKK